MKIKFDKAGTINGRTLPTEWTEIANPEAVYMRPLAWLEKSGMKIKSTDNRTTDTETGSGITLPETVIAPKHNRRR